jgi:hypothetical protein
MSSLTYGWDSMLVTRLYSEQASYADYNLSEWRDFVANNHKNNTELSNYLTIGDGEEYAIDSAIDKFITGVLSSISGLRLVQTTYDRFLYGHHRVNPSPVSKAPMEYESENVHARPSGTWVVTVTGDPYPLGTISIQWMKHPHSKDKRTLYRTYCVTSPHINLERYKGVGTETTSNTITTMDQAKAIRLVKQHMRKRSLENCAYNFACNTKHLAATDTEQYADKAHSLAVNMWKCNTINEMQNETSGIIDANDMVHMLVKLYHEGYEFPSSKLHGVVRDFVDHYNYVKSLPLNNDRVCYVNWIKGDNKSLIPFDRVDVVPMSRNNKSDVWHPMDSSYFKRYDNRNGWEDSGFPDDLYTKLMLLDMADIDDWVTGSGVKLGEGAYCVVYDLV